MADKIAGIGMFMMAAGVISALLSFVGYELRILMWIEMWGSGMAWVIRGGLVVGGIALVGIPAMIGGGDSSDESNSGGSSGETSA